MRGFEGTGGGRRTRSSFVSFVYSALIYSDLQIIPKTPKNSQNMLYHTISLSIT